MRAKSLNKNNAMSSQVNNSPKFCHWFQIINRLKPCWQRQNSYLIAMNSCCIFSQSWLSQLNWCEIFDSMCNWIFTPYGYRIPRTCLPKLYCLIDDAVWYPTKLGIERAKIDSEHSENIGRRWFFFPWIHNPIYFWYVHVTKINLEPCVLPTYISMQWRFFS